MMLSQSYRVPFVLTSQMDEDLRYIRKMNTLFKKLEKTGKENYVKEIINILKILNNSLFLEKSLSVFYNLIEQKFHPDMEEIIFKMIGKNVD